MNLKKQVMNGYKHTRAEKLQLLEGIKTGRIKLAEIQEGKYFFYQDSKLFLLDNKGNVKKEIDPIKFIQINDKNDHIFTINPNPAPNFEFKGIHISLTTREIVNKLIEFFEFG